MGIIATPPKRAVRASIGGRGQFPTPRTGICESRIRLDERSPDPRPQAISTTGEAAYLRAFDRIW